jgi:hypothetical protein
MIGAGAAALTLPFLQVARGQPSNSSSSPKKLKRLVVFYLANGQAPGKWAPTGGEKDFKLSTVLQPLEPYRNDVIVLDGVGFQSAIADPSGSGHSQIAHMLTAVKAVGSYHAKNIMCSVVSSAGGVSVDQFIAQKIGQSSAFPSLQFGVQIGETELGWQRVSYLGPRQPVQPDEDPYHAYKRIFAGSASSPEQQVQLLSRRNSVLDFVKGDVARLRKELGTRDQQRLSAHLDTIREVEQSLNAPPGAQCMATPFGMQLDTRAPANYAQLMKMQMDLLVASLACGRTNVSVMMASSARNFQTTPSWIGINDSAHNLQHHYIDGPAQLNQFLTMHQWYASQFAYLVGKLKSIDEGDGTTMLDNTAVLWADSLGEPSTHTPGPVPLVLAGGRNYFRTGRYVKIGAPSNGCTAFDSHGRLLVSLCQAMGIQTDTFGDPAFCRGGAFSELT